MRALLLFPGLQNAAGRYLTTGKGRTSKNGKIFHAAGAKISRYQSRASSADALLIVGPTSAPLRVVVRFHCNIV